MLDEIKSPDALKNYTVAELSSLSEEIRKVILDTVAMRGGHLSSNLGMVEATVVMHHLFQSPEDKIIFDVGHQCYAHKLLTGRYENFQTLRSFGGISGFTSRSESEHDILNEGHCGTSISAALGIAEANKLNGNDHYTIAVVGDGALTNGMIYEALNNCAGKNLRLIIVINDNDMSISRNVGGLHQYLSKIRTSKGYLTFKHRFEKFLLCIPLVGRGLASFFKALKDAFKHTFTSNNIFEDLGLIYIGPVDGNNIEKLITVFDEAKSKPKCCVVHMVTKKGKGYAPAAAEPDRYHSVPPFDLAKGIAKAERNDYSTHMGALLCQEAAKDEKLCAITAAMCDGTGLGAFAAKYPQRFFDVGIAEEHAITFAGGLAVSGMKPVVLLYSTFAQRVYDQVFHDISLQRLPLVLALDHAGLVPGDGVTHQGIFDVALFSSVPGAVIYSPETFAEMDEVLPLALSEIGLSIIRYPRGRETTYQPFCVMRRDESGLFDYSENAPKAKVAIVTYGRLTAAAQDAIERLHETCDVALIKLIRLLPLNIEAVLAHIPNVEWIYFLEEGIRTGGVGEQFIAGISGAEKIKNVIHAIDGFVEHGSLGDIDRACGFTGEAIADDVANILVRFE